MLRLVEGLMGLLALVLIFSQIIVPAWNGKPMFPIFRRKVAEREEALIAAEDAADDAETAARVARLRSGNTPPSITNI